MTDRMTTVRNIRIDDMSLTLILAALRAYTPTMPNVTLDDHEEQQMLIGMIDAVLADPDAEIIHDFTA